MSHLDEQWRMYDGEKTTLTEQLDVLRKNAKDLNPTTVKDAKTNRYIQIMQFLNGHFVSLNWTCAWVLFQKVCLYACMYVCIFVCLSAPT